MYLFIFLFQLGVGLLLYRKMKYCNESIDFLANLIAATFEILSPHKKEY